MIANIVRKTRLSYNRGNRDRIAILEMQEKDGRFYILQKIGPAGQLAESFKTPTQGVDRATALGMFGTLLGELGSKGFVVTEDSTENGGTTAVQLAADGTIGTRITPAEAATVFGNAKWFGTAIATGESVAVVSYDAPSGELIVPGTTEAVRFAALRDAAESEDGTPSFTAIAVSGADGHVTLLDILSIDGQLLSCEEAGYSTRRDVLECFAEAIGVGVIPEVDGAPAPGEAQLFFFLRSRAYDRRARAMLTFTGHVAEAILVEYQPNWTGTFVFERLGAGEQRLTATLPLGARLVPGDRATLIVSGDLAAVVAHAE